MTDRPAPTNSVDPPESATVVYRHPVAIRLTHWIGVICLAILFMSGLQIFNAHPALYLGQASDFAHPIAAMGTEQQGDRTIGVTRIFGHVFDTSGLLGVSGAASDQTAFPGWVTLPGYQDLATGRRWHFFFAWLLVFDGSIYLIYSLASGHVWRELIPSSRQFRRIGRSIVDHLRLRFPRGREARHYNILQRLSYLIILFVVLPLIILTGLTMSPGLDAAFPFLTVLFAGRQTARTIHFICAFLVVGFAIVHVVMVLVSGVFNNMRSMITGWYALEPKAQRHDEAA